MRTVLFIFSAILFSNPAHAKLNVVTSVTDLKYLVQKVGKDLVEVESIGRGTQDPHFVDAKPSFMTKVSRSDLVVCIGLGLEDAWLNNVISGARNPKVRIGSSGYLAVGPKLHPEEIPEGAALSRSEGDVHPEGNPHVTLDPVRAAEAANLIAAKLAELDPSHSSAYLSNGKEYSEQLKKKAAEWKKRISLTGPKRVVTYHKTLDYFLRSMGIELLTVLEPKPGIEPSVNHLSEVIQVMKGKNVNVVLIENYFNPNVAGKLKELNGLVLAEVVPVSVEGAESIKSLEDLYENLVSTLERMSKGGRK
jgi:ABC-type Zn uptake system ZnuABC Zn-binding protein ZnuA